MTEATKTPDAATAGVSDSTQLLACPFCGKTEALHITTSSESWAEDHDEPYPHTESYAVNCDASDDADLGGCGATGGYATDKAAAILRWNARQANVLDETRRP